MAEREQPWVDGETRSGRIVVYAINPIAEALKAIAEVAGRTVVLVDEEGGLASVEGLQLVEGDSVVICDHDASEAGQVLRHALASPSSYVAMMASRRRAERLVPELEGEGQAIETLHLPAGLNIGGKLPGEIALSVVAEIVAVSNGRPGGPHRADPGR